MEQIIKQFLAERNSKKATRKNYRIALERYSKFCGLSMAELINEADAEEEKGIRMKRRTLKTRLVNFRTALYSEVSPNTAKLYFGLVKSFYMHHEIQIPYLPYMKVEKGVSIKHDDIPSRDDIKKAYEYANPIMKAVMLFICSSGCARTETLNLTIQDFMDATDEFSNEMDVKGRCAELLKMDGIIPIWQVHRQKTDKDYFTYCSSEAVHEICKYLLNRKDELSPSAQLFKIYIQYLNTKFRQLNDMIGGGKCGAWVKLRPHSLRKFNASALINAEENAWTIEEVDAIQGRSKDSTHRAYFLEDPKKLRNKYKLVMHELTILNDGKLLSDFEKVKTEKELLEEKINEQEDKLKSMMEEMKKISSILNVSE